MTSRPGDGERASATIPYLFRFPLLFLEPLFALSGAILVYTQPSNYVMTMSRSAVTAVDSSTKFVYTELAGGWLHLAFTEAIVFRLVDDARVWRLLCIGMLLSDVAYCHSCAQAVGGWSNWVVLSRWTIEDWIVAITTWPFAFARLAIVFRLGVKDANTTQA